ncbi:MAG: hypothetical protein JST38_13115 [Bacteroidetes bacterium]|nr:hypothetical protein [Bacteroidota bacterium]
MDGNAPLLVLVHPPLLARVSFVLDQKTRAMNCKLTLTATTPNWIFNDLGN